MALLNNDTDVVELDFSVFCAYDFINAPITNVATTFPSFLLEDMQILKCKIKVKGLTIKPWELKTIVLKWKNDENTEGDMGPIMNSRRRLNIGERKDRHQAPPKRKETLKDDISSVMKAKLSKEENFNRIAVTMTREERMAKIKENAI